MRLDPPDSRTLTRSERWALACFILLMLGGFTLEVVRDFQPAKLSALFILLAWFPLLVAHEAGHALVAALVGWRVRRVVIGFGRPLARLFLRGTLVEFRAIPLEGFTLPVPRELRLIRLKSFLVYLGGPLAEALLLGATALIWGVEELLTRSEQVATIGAQGFSVAIIMGLIINLVPHSAETQNGPSPNDGLGMIQSILLSPAVQEAMVDEWDP